MIWHDNWYDIIEKSADRVIVVQGVVVLLLVIAIGQWPTRMILWWLVICSRCL